MLTLTTWNILLCLNPLNWFNYSINGSLGREFSVSLFLFVFPSEGVTPFSRMLYFQGCLYSKHPWTTKMVSPPEQGTYLFPVYQAGLLPIIKDSRSLCSKYLSCNATHCAWSLDLSVTLWELGLENQMQMLTPCMLQSLCLWARSLVSSASILKLAG